MTEPDEGEDENSQDIEKDDTDEHEDGGADANLKNIWNEERVGRLVLLAPEPMASFLKALASIETECEGLVRILHYGDSHTAADFLSTVLRRALQKRFGDGGRGFVFLGKPWRSYMPKDVETSARGHWETRRILMAAKPERLDGRYGLGGVAVDATKPTSAIRVSTMRGSGFGNRMSSFDIFFMEQPGGGSFTVNLDGKHMKTVKTARRRIGSGFFQLEMDEGIHEVEVKLKGDGKVRLFGAVLESDGPGVVYDTLGINGAFFYTPLRWDASLLEEQVARRDPDLIITMYGANEADSRNLTPLIYARRVKKTLSRLRAGAPNAACLMLGPLDRKMPSPVGDEPTQLDWIIDVQNDVADEVGCAFLDMQELMGGPGSHKLWRTRGLAQQDGIHLTVSGYRVLGEMLAKQILDAYERYLEETNNPEQIKQNNSPGKMSGG
ncbi:MAG: hypothetical protein GY847_34630 [Proteobacteria bacterium]|nr:hypothetical protein [Pseudomonadota bacterium]